MAVAMEIPRSYEYTIRTVLYIYVHAGLMSWDTSSFTLRSMLSEKNEAEMHLFTSEVTELAKPHQRSSKLLSRKAPSLIMSIHFTRELQVTIIMVLI